MRLRCLLAITFVASGALAQDRRDPLAAEALFREGRDAFKRGDWATACPKFEESMRLDPAAGTLFNLADCEEHAGHVASAWLRWQALADMLRTTPSDERYAVAKKHAVDLEPRLPRLRIRWSGEAPAGAVVKRDGVEVGPASLNEALPIDSGKHRVDVSAPSHKSKTFDVITKEGSITELAISLGESIEAEPEPKVDVKPDAKPDVPPPPPLIPAAKPRAATGSGLTPVGVSFTILGSALTLGAILTGVGAIAEKSTVDANCNANKLCNGTGASAASAGKALATASSVFTVIGPLLLVSGITFVVIGGASSRVGVSASPRFAGLTFEGRFQ